ncbi:putative membrane protein [Coccomyxa subellipsoidea C-169]|uniref:Membrane protein n=1 Tax=Coccomyxa subellipsoidea (strain C-169) TaxID=574566 RepID=I0YTT5_COCSC|nr:putative membrane protein [Coccomyxa subellipsoidea C-169]EIE21804.1 putative membrane protein [Coccomyxa subellipsoidea C-169]|eukprot:XP_005646348.1 putative membrane protein [Coccomyxa subellipsoidea C-169]
MLCSVTQSGQDPGPNYISPGQVALGAAIVIVNAFVSVWLKLDMHWQLLVGVIRCVVQLTVLGYILVPIFTYNLWWLVLLYAFFMLFVGSLEAVQRPAYTYKGMLLQTLSCVGTSAGVFLSYTLLFVVRTHPWWAPQYFIPILGMMLGNSISGVSVGLSALLEDFSVGKDRIEQLLALGATRWEATQASIQRCVRMALTPIMNQMNVVGIVSIPGMMTGQILSGSDPSQAARYQMIIMFIIAASTGVGAVASLMFTSFYLVDMSSRLRLDRIHKRDNTNKWNHRLMRKIATVHPLL